jgi:hypothetical protein
MNNKEREREREKKERVCVSVRVCIRLCTIFYLFQMIKKNLLYFE